MIDRRRFLKSGLTLAAGAACSWPFDLLAAKPESALRLTILHTNDVHSHLEPMKSGDYAGLGGASARASLISRVREQEKHVLLLDAGDVFQGTPYFNIFKGEPEARAMSAMRFDAGTIGNHEFDAGIERLAEVIRTHMNFPILNCNYGINGTPLEGATREHLVIEKEGLRIGLLGLGIRLEGLVFPGYYGDLRYRDPIADAKRVATHLREEEKCDFIICLSHLNLYARRVGDAASQPGDRDLIREVPEIDLVIGGHNHIYLERPDVYYRKESTGFIAQAGWAGTHMGRLSFDIFGRSKREVAGWTIHPAVA